MVCIRVGVFECISGRESNEDFGTRTQSEFTLSTEEVQVWPVARNECGQLVSDHGDVFSLRCFRQMIQGRCVLAQSCSS